MMRGVRASRSVDGARQRPALRERPAQVPLARREERERHVERLRLHVLGQRDRDGARLGRVGEHAHGRERDRVQLIGPLHAVEEARERAERVVHAHARVVRVLELLQHRIRDPRREGVARQEQRRQPVGRCEGRAREHVGGARPDGRGARVGREAAVHAREADGLVHHRLLVAGLVVRHEVGILRVGLHERLADPGDVAVAEDPEDAGDGALAVVAVDRPLVREERDERLADGHAGGGLGHGVGASWSGAKGRRGSISCPAHVPRIQPCAGWSLMSQARSAPGPAITLR